jgi:arylsulfatase A-like enzyme
MKQIATFALVVLVFCCDLALMRAMAAPPNIIVVMADDHGQWALGAYGLSAMQTPNLDWMAERGVMFRNAMSPSPVCSPARASFYTGKMPSQHGVHDFLQEDVKYDHNWLAGETLLSEHLQKEGYRTALIGKWHATTDSSIPQAGFDKWLSYDALKAGWRNQYLHRGTVKFSEDGNPTQYTGVQARFLTQQAVDFIDQSSSKPFFISLNLVEPHAPFAGLPERLVDHYRPIAGKIIRAGNSSDLPNLNKHTLVPDEHEEQLAQYLAAVSLIDEQVGTVLDALEGRDLLDNTLLIYTSDHGMLMGQYGLYGKANASYPPNFYEETIRIPLIFFGSEQLLRGHQSRGELVDLIDLHTTIRDIASGGKHPDSDYGPGRSLRPLLNGQRTLDWRRFQVSERGNARMITDGHWKLVRYYSSDSASEADDRWYDLSHPLGERHRSPVPRKQVRELLSSNLDQFFERYEVKGKSGRYFWSQPFPNAKTEKLMK